MVLQFEWDEAKAGSNRRKHRVAFAEAATVFGDPLAWTFFDPDHAEDETRFLTIGASDAGRLLIVAHAEWGEAIRIISVRLASPQDRRYDERERWAI